MRARQDLLALGSDHGVERDLAARAVEPADRALAEAEVMPVRDREVVEIVRVGVHAARRDLVQQRLPHVRRVAVDQRDLHVAAAAVAVAQLRRERQPAGAAADARRSDASAPSSFRAGGSFIATPMRRHASTLDLSA